MSEQQMTSDKIAKIRALQKQLSDVAHLLEEFETTASGAVCYVVGQLRSAPRLERVGLGGGIASPAQWLCRVQSSRNDASEMPWWDETKEFGTRTSTWVNILKTEPMATYELARKEAARLYKRDFSRLAENLPLIQGEPNNE